MCNSACMLCIIRVLCCVIMSRIVCNVRVHRVCLRMCGSCVRLGACGVGVSVCGCCSGACGVGIRTYTHMRVYNKIALTVFGIFVINAVIFARGIIIYRLSCISPPVAFLP